MKHLRKLNKYLWRYKWYLIFGILFVILSNVFRVIQPKVIGRALDTLLEKIETGNQANIDTDLIMSDISGVLLKFAGLVLLFALLMGIFMYFMRQTIIVMSRKIEFDLRNDIFKHYESLHLGFFKVNNTGDLMARITEDVSKVRMYLGPAILYTINLSSMVIMAIAFMLQVNVSLTLWTLLPLPILSITIYYISNIINKRSTKIQQKLSDLNSFAQESFSGIRIIKSYVKENFFAKTFHQECEDYRTVSLHLAQVNAFFYPLMVLLIGASTLITIYVGGIYVLNGKISHGNIAEFIIYVNMLTWPVASLGWVASIIQQAAASQERINEFLDIQPEIINQVSTNQTELEGKLEFRNVSFVYPDSGILALDRISFCINPGEKVLLVGRTASGKSTIADLILRMYDPSEGVILLDGKDIKEWNLHDLRKLVAYVPQDNFLFSDSVASNIAFGLDAVNAEQVEKYAAHASVHNDIMDLPKKYDTVVGERGVSLSGGQKQRITLARSFIKDPKFVIIDDSLSAVDSETEHRIISYLNSSLADKTSIIITHRVHGSMDYDRILVIDHGKLIVSGSHQELMTEENYYSEIFNQYQSAQQEML